MSSPNLEIRDAKKEDLTQISRWSSASINAANLEFEDLQAYLLKQSICNIFRVAVKNGEPIGYLIGHIAKSKNDELSGCIEYFQLKEDERGYGYGRSMVENSFDLFRQQGCNSAFVGLCFESAHGFYESLDGKWLEGQITWDLTV